MKEETPPRSSNKGFGLQKAAVVVPQSQPAGPFLQPFHQKYPKKTSLAPEEAHFERLLRILRECNSAERAHWALQSLNTFFFEEKDEIMTKRVSKLLLKYHGVATILVAMREWAMASLPFALVAINTLWGLAYRMPCVRGMILHIGGERGLILLAMKHDNVDLTEHTLAILSSMVEVVDIVNEGCINFVLQAMWRFSYRPSIQNFGCYYFHTVLRRCRGNIAFKKMLDGKNVSILLHQAKLNFEKYEQEHSGPGPFSYASMALQEYYSFDTSKP